MSQPFLRTVAEDIRKQFGDELSNIAVVFNSKRPITHLKKHLADVYQKTIWSPHFFTIQEFFKRSTDKAEASVLTQIFYLYELHNGLLKEEGNDPETLEDFYPIAEIILNDFGQLDYELVKVDQIYMELFDTTKIDVEFQHFTLEQQQFIRQFWQSFSVSEHSGIQQRFLRLWRRLPVLYIRFKEKLAQEGQTNYPSIYRDLVEGKATNQHFASQYKKVLFVGFNALNRVEAKLFTAWQEEGQALFYFDADAYYVDDELQEAGLFIRRNISGLGLINQLGNAPNRLGNRTTDIHLYAASGKVSETKLLHDILVKNETDEKSSAILLADESLLVPLLQSLPPIKVNITTGFPLLQSPIFGLIDLWLDVQEEVAVRKKPKIQYKLVETFLSHPYTQVSYRERNALQQEVHEKQLFDLPLEKISIASSALPRFFNPVLDDTKLIPTLVGMIEHLLTATASSGIDLQINSTLLFETRRILLQLSLGFEKIGPLSIHFQIGVIRKAVAPINAAIEGDPLQGVQIMGLLESRCLNFDRVYILGTNEGILPKTSNSPTFLPNNLRRAYGLPILENQDALSAYLFYRHFQYSEGIHLFYNSVVDESSTGEESRFIKQLEFESRFTFQKYTQQQPIAFAPTEKELIISKEGKIWDALYNKYIRSGTRFSATALTTYLQSPLQFFLKHVAEIKEPPAVAQEFEMNKLGNIIHNTMEEIFKPFIGIDKFTDTKALQKQICLVDAKVVTQIGQEYHSPLASIDELNSLQRIMHKIASEYVKMFIEHDIANYTAFKIVELENKERYLIDFPIQINAREEHISLYGIIDRVDEVITHDGEVKCRIVDYKTGADSVSFKDIDKVFSPNTENKALVQTLFYSYVFEQVTKRHDLEPHLYVARRMREEGTLFRGKTLSMEGEMLAEQKKVFVDFLRDTLEEIFDPTVPFRHNPEMHVYESDPYQLFYRNAVAKAMEENEDSE